MAKQQTNQGDSLGGGVRLIGCTATGPRHETNDKPCQDHWVADALPKSRFVTAVGDGLGSASHSQRGARRATCVAAKELEDYLLNGGSVEQKKIRSEMKGAFKAARKALIKEAEQINQPVSSLNTTLLLLAGGPSWGAAGAVGDGGVVGHYDGDHYLMVPRENTEYANETTPITSDHWEDSYRFGYRENIEAVAIFTDGLDPFVWDGNDSPRKSFFDQVFGFVQSAQHLEKAEQELCEFLNDDHFREYSGDDKTLVIAMFPPVVESS